jgi:RNA polymerase sigma factor (sigma-70 family)
MKERITARSADEVVASPAEERSHHAALFDRHYDYVWRYLCRRAGAVVADELASEVFVRALSGQAAVDGGLGAARAWLYGIATNVLREHSRGEGRRWRAYARALEPAATAGGLDDVDERVDAVARGPAVARALAGLPAADRDTLLLFALTELDYEGIGIATGVPIGTVRSRLHRARRRIRIELDLDQAATDSHATMNRSAP